MRAAPRVSHKAAASSGICGPLERAREGACSGAARAHGRAMPVRALSCGLMLVACSPEGAVEPAGVIHSTIAAVPVQEGWAVNYPKQHKLFEIDGSLWLFHSDGTAMVS